LPKRVLSSTQVATAVTAIHQTTDMGIPVTAGAPERMVSITPALASHWNSQPPISPLWAVFASET
jgi:hypothetical protein